MDHKERERLAYFSVQKFLKISPEFFQMREDLLQEAQMSIIKAEGSYDRTKGYPFGLWCSYRIMYDLKNYVVKERKHFLRQPADPESPYWDIEDPPLPDQLPDEADEHKLLVKELVDGISFTENQLVLLESFMRDGDFLGARKTLGISKQRASQIWADVVRKIKKANELP